MHRLIWGIVGILALTAAVQAKDCSGQGSAQVLTFEEWILVPEDNGVVELTYRLHEDKPVTLLSAHVYFEIDSDNVPADAALELANPAGLTPGGTGTVTLSKPMARRLAAASAAAPGSVTASTCTNYMQYLDGSGVIID